MKETRRFNMTILGKPVTRTASGVTIGKNAGNIRFDGKP